MEGEWLDLTFSADSESFKLGPGIIYYGKEKEDYASQSFFMPRAKVIHLDRIRRRNKNEPSTLLVGDRKGSDRWQGIPVGWTWIRQQEPHQCVTSQDCHPN